LFAAFLLYPLVRSVYLSLHRSVGPGELAWAGTGNYAFLMRDPLFWWATANTVAFTVAFVALQVPLSLGLALWLDRPMRGKNLLRFAFFAPHLIGGVFVAVIFNVILGGRRGPVNVALGRLGLGPLEMLTDPDLAMPAVLVAALWLSVGYGVVYLLAALQSVDRSLHEAASVDGAGPWARFRHVTLPAIGPVLGFLVLTGTIGGLQVFELPYVLLQGAGPDGRGLTAVMYLFFAAFEQGDLGYASAVGWTLAVLIAGAVLLQRAIARRL